MGKARVPNPDGRLKSIVMFASLFLGSTIAFHLVFDLYPGAVVLVYVRSISLAARLVLRAIGIDAEVMTDLQMGACTLRLDAVSYLVTQGCTGLFTTALYISGVVSLPVATRKKLIGLMIGVPAFFVFGALRIVIMSIVAIVEPSRVEVFHVYIMAIANLGFAMFVWSYWFNRVVGREKLGPVSG